MPTLLLTPRADIRDTSILADAAARQYWTVRRSANYHPLPVEPSDDVVLYGETLFTTLAGRALSLAILEPPFDFLVTLPPEYRHRHIELTTLEAAKRLQVPMFVKPADGNKAFDARVYRNGGAISSQFLPKTLPVLVSEPVEWVLEFRCFVFERQIMTFSIYARSGQLAENSDGKWKASETEMMGFVAFCHSILSDQRIELPPAVVLDVGQLPDGRWALVEANPASSSGVYGCYPEGVLVVLQRACIPMSQLTDEDRRWLVDRPI